MRRFLPLLILISLVGITQSGCYLVSQAKGQIRISHNSISLEEAAELPEMTEEKLAKIKLIGQVKNFAETELGLTKTGNYTKYYPGGTETPLWVLTVAHKDKLEIKKRLGSNADYRNYYNKRAAKKEQRKMKRMGYDTYLRSAGAYSTGATVIDPITPLMLEFEDYITWCRQSLTSWLIQLSVHGMIHPLMKDSQCLLGVMALGSLQKKLTVRTVNCLKN